MLLISICLFSIWTTIIDIAADLTGQTILGISTITISGGASGYSIINFMLLYCIGAYLKKWYVASKPFYFYTFIYLLLSIISFLIELVTPVMRNYSNILTILQAVFLMLAFSKLNIGIIRFVNIISSATFGVYLIHTQSLITKNFWSLFDIANVNSSRPLKFIYISILTILLTYILCLVIDFSCRYVTRPLSKWLNRQPILQHPIVDIQEPVLIKGGNSHEGL